MNRILSLSKVMLKNTSPLFSLANKKSQKEGKPKAKILPIFGFLVLFLYVAGMSGFMFYGIASELKQSNETLILSSIFSLLLLALGLFFGLIILFSFLFLAADNEKWLPLPFKTEEIFTARFLTTLLFVYLVEVIIIIPALIGFNIIAFPGILALIGQLLVLIAMPILALSFSYILLLGLSKIVNIQKKRRLFQIISSVLIFVFTFGISFAASFGGQTTSDSQDFTMIVNLFRDLANKMGWLRFLTIFTDGAFINKGILSIVLPLVLLLIALLFFVLAYYLSSKYYHASLFSIDVSKKKRHKGQTKEMVKTTKPVNAFFQNELRTIFRSPTYFFNLVAPAAMVLIIVIVALIGGMSSVPETEYTLQELIYFFFNPDNGTTFVIGLGIIGFLSMMNMSSATSISREGKNAILLKTYPVSAKQILYGKMLLGLIVNAAIIIPLVIVLGIIGRGNVFVILAYILGSSLINLAMNYASIVLDARFPMLNWTNEIEAAKQNKNVLISMGVNLLFNGAIFLPIIPTIMLELPVAFTFLIFAFIFIAIILIINQIVARYKGHLFSKIQ